MTGRRTPGRCATAPGQRGDPGREVRVPGDEKLVGVHAARHDRGAREHQQPADALLHRKPDGGWSVGTVDGDCEGGADLTHSGVLQTPYPAHQN